MNSMKKIFNYILIAFFIIAAILVIVILLIPEKNQLTILSVEQEYLLASNEEETKLNMVAFASEKNSAYFNQQSITDAYILNYENKEKFKVVIDNIDNTKKKVSYMEKDYYQYNFTLGINFFADQKININNAYLVLDYPDDSSINFRIGSIVRYYAQNEGDLEYTRLKGIINAYDKKSYLCGILINLNSTNKIKITDIYSLSSGVNTDGKNIMIGDMSYASNINMHDIIKSYNPLDLSTQMKPLYLEGSQTLFIPLVYDSLKQITISSFVIKYEYNGEVYEKLIYPFKYFDVKNAYDYKINKVTYDANKNH